MAEEPLFRKHDRYKASSYRAYNFKFPTQYDSSFWMTFCQMPLADRTVVEALGPDIGSLTILDVGCATGRLLRKLASAGARRLAGTDLAPRILDVAREKLAEAHADVELRPADAEDSLPWPAESFDVVTLTGVLHHFYRPHDALREIRRVLRPRGRMLLMGVCLFPPVRQLVNLYTRVVPHWGDYRFYSKKAASKLMQRAGFRCVQARRVGWSLYFITAVKADDSFGRSVTAC